MRNIDYNYSGTDSNSVPAAANGLVYAQSDFPGSTLTIYNNTFDTAPSISENGGFYYLKGIENVNISNSYYQGARVNFGIGVSEMYAAK